MNMASSAVPSDVLSQLTILKTDCTVGAEPILTEEGTFNVSALVFDAALY